MAKIEEKNTHTNTNNIDNNGIKDEVSQQRAALPIQRTHQRFLLRQLQFTQQYAAMYRCRLLSLQQRALSALTAKMNAVNPPNGECMPALSPLLELQTGQRGLCVGVIYKQMRLLPSFLREYQKELVRIETGEEEEGGDKGDAADILSDLPPSADDPASLLGAGDAGVELVGEQNQHQEQNTLCRASDEVFIEDISGRVLLENVPAELLCTGLVLSVDGTLHKNGCLKVHSYAMTDLREIYVPRRLHESLRLKPCYIAFVSGLEVGYPQTQDPEVVRNRTMVELLVDYLCGNVGDESMTTQASQIARLVIAGNSIAATDELKLKKKVKLDPSDHVRLGDDRRGTTGVVNSAMLMSELDNIMTRIADTIEVDLMPGDFDMSNAFQPQQPLHPLLLPEAARRSSLKLVTNPYEFSVFPSTSTVPKLTSTGKPSEGGTTFFVSSGSSLNDVCRETKYPTRLDAMSMILRSGCACPTAPNTLFSYPFKDSDPFLFPSAPHCFVCCDQPEMQTRWESLESFGPNSDAIMDEEGYENNNDNAGLRLICIPSFARTGVLVLVDVNSPNLDTVTVNFSSSASNGTSQ
ncbi:DNA polymerase delta subunit [Trypanosoma melophagium]|uniref:DNA polymerase delta subunit n=1 Tax=Trypanosoma melophagium TaxID=715481 RepID=UPI00351A85BD|nr:DNA polymerase delta subunit [Trypanosoma melophagium]